MPDASAAVVSDLAPTGKLRVGLNMSNFLLTRTDEKCDALAGLRPRLIADQANLAGSRILDGNFTAVQQAAGVPKGRAAGARYLREFIEEAKESGLVAKTIEANGVRGLTVAAASRVQDERGAE